MNIESNKQNVKGLNKKVILGIGAIIAVIAVVLCVKTVGGKNASSTGYKTPEKAIEAFTESIAAGDFSEALSIFDNRERTEGINLKKYIERMQVFDPQNMPAPQGGEYDILNKAESDGRAAAQIKMFVYSLQEAKKLKDGTITDGMDVGNPYSAKEIVELLDSENLKGLKMERCDIADKDTQSAERYTSNLENVYKIYGCEEMKEYTALLKKRDKFYQAFFTLGKYEKGWKVMTLNTSLIEAPSSGATVETTKKEYVATIEEKKGEK